MAFVRFFIILCFSFVCSNNAFSQKQGNLIEKSLQLKKIPFTITQFSTKNGLAQNQVINIIPKNDGSLILYTSNGIVNFDGYEFKPVTIDKNYKKQFFVNLHYFKNTNELIGLDENNQLYKLFPEFKSFEIKNIIPYYSAVTHDSLFIISDKWDIHLFDLKRNTSQLFVSNSNYFPINTLNRASLFHGSKLYLATSSGLYIVDLKTKKVKQLSKLDYTTLKVNPFNQKIYGIADQSIHIIDNERTEDSIVHKLPIAKAMDIAFVNKTTLYIATINGLYLMRDRALHRYGKADGLPSTYLHSLHLDTIYDCLFVGTGEKGLLKLQFKNNYTISSKDGLPEFASGSIIKTKEGKIISSIGNAIYEIKQDTCVIYTKLKRNYGCLANINDLVYAGTWGDGIKIFKNGVYVDSIHDSYKLPNPVVHACFQDSKGNIWIGTGKGISKGKDKASINPILSNEIKETIICFYELKNGYICVGCTGGFYIISDNKILQKITSKEGFNGKEVRSFYEDSEGKIWIGSYDDGIYCYANYKLTSINSMKNCMLYRDAFCIAPDGKGFLYFTSNYGLWRVSEKSLNDFYKGNLSYLIPFQYSEETGILNTEFNGGFQNNYLKTNSGHFLFPSIEGIVSLSPEKLITRKLSAEIDNIYVNDTLINIKTNQFERSTHSVQFEFSCNSFTVKQNVYFQHKLTGEKNYEWSIPQKQTTVYLKMLPPGKYTFWVRAIDGCNETEPITTKFTFVIKPYVYETWWFMILISLLVGLLIITGVKFRIANQKRKIEQKEFYKRKISEVELNAIQAQLNPHFIFNCMNTIKYFILEKDFSNANDGLNRLSKLIRSSLENSEDMFIPLEQELTFITNYVELEKMRLQDHLQYTITIEPDISGTISIPHLLIQPYIENAIKHGIANLEDKTGKLTIEFSHIAENLVCTIIDNGIGRVASRKLNMHEEYHSSKGTQLSKEKSNLLNQYYNYKCTIEVMDLYIENNASNGTKVIIKMPVKHESSNNR